KEYIIQFRASGIRVKLPTFSPALNLCGTQIPVLPWVKLPESCVPQYSDEDLKRYGLSREDVKYGRYLSVKESACLQGMDNLIFGNLSKTRIYEALGNAVNTQVVELIAKNLIKTI
ncbi:MAG: DNA cytosine methyltransferase, partial [Prevotella sp.]|nr:DNA cytosine methyltransferase [Prevotella sp.]